MSRFYKVVFIFLCIILFYIPRIIAQVTWNYSAEKAGGVVTLQFGDIPNYYRLQSPKQYLHYIQEANAGFQPYKNLWFEFGYYLTHIGAEGKCIGKF